LPKRSTFWVGYGATTLETTDRRTVRQQTDGLCHNVVTFA